MCISPIRSHPHMKTEFIHPGHPGGNPICTWLCFIHSFTLQGIVSDTSATGVAFGLSLDLVFLLVESISGWWLTYPSEK